jgi:quinohemoprotein ethanol dehydrogenase
VPLAVDGVVYFTVGQSIVHAVDAQSGKLLWRYDPEVTKVAGRKLRITWGPRGIAYWAGRIYVGTTDGRLIAIDAHDGQRVWSTLTVDPDNEMTITGPPRAFNGKVLIGNAGSEFGANRGYVTAYDAETVQQVWRFYIVPGNPANGFEDDAMKMAAATWTGEWWKVGGGGQAWNALTYDPSSTASTSAREWWPVESQDPQPGRRRQPVPVLDRRARCRHRPLRLALPDDAGRDVGFQFVDGHHARHAADRGQAAAGDPARAEERFFYVIDRSDGKLLSAEKFGKVTWAERVDLATGRPVEAPNARYEHGPVQMWPSTMGVHNWQPMSFNAATGLVYIPTLEMMGSFDDTGVTLKDYKVNSTQLNVGLKQIVAGDIPKDAGKSALLAWDPLAQKPVWNLPTPGFWNGGTMTTAGGLVFQGQADGLINAYDARDGRKLWSFDAHMGISGAPITFLAGGQQYVAVVAGWGGSAPGLFWRVDGATRLAGSRAAAPAARVCARRQGVVAEHATARDGATRRRPRIRRR